jgi:hypothetical protein
MPAEQIDFNCSLGWSGSGRHFSICQAPNFQIDNYNIGSVVSSGKLLSDLRDVDEWAAANASLRDSNADSPYLIFNTTFGATSHQSHPHGSQTEHGAWTDLTYIPLDLGETTFQERPNVYANVSVSLCFPAFWTARLHVDLHALENRTEPTALISDGWYRTDPDVHVQMGENARKREEM